MDSRAGVCACDEARSEDCSKRKKLAAGRVGENKKTRNEGIVKLEVTIEAGRGPRQSGATTIHCMRQTGSQGRALKVAQELAIAGRISTDIEIMGRNYLLDRPVVSDVWQGGRQTGGYDPLGMALR